MNLFILPIEIFLIEINRTQIQSTLTILGAQDGHFVCDSILFMEQGHRIDGYRLNFVCNIYLNISQRHYLIALIEHEVYLDSGVHNSQLMDW